MMQNKFEYKELRDKIHEILFSFFDWELICSKNNEFDFEFLEFRTDEILRLIQQQGGSI